MTGTALTGLGSHAPTYVASRTIGFDIADPANTFTVAPAFVASHTLTKVGTGTLAFSGTGSKRSACST